VIVKGARQNVLGVVAGGGKEERTRREKKGRKKSRHRGESGGTPRPASRREHLIQGDKERGRRRNDSLSRQARKKVSRGRPRRSLEDRLPALIVAARGRAWSGPEDRSGSRPANSPGRRKEMKRQRRGERQAGEGKKVTKKTLMRLRGNGMLVVADAAASLTSSVLCCGHPVQGLRRTSGLAPARQPSLGSIGPGSPGGTDPGEGGPTAAGLSAARSRRRIRGDRHV